MTLGYIELESQNDIIDLDWPTCDLTYRPSIVLHSEPKYNIYLSLMTSNNFLHLLLVRLWKLHIHHDMVTNHIFPSIIKYIVIGSCEHGISVRIQLNSSIHNMFWLWLIICCWNDAAFPCMHLVHWNFDVISTTDIQNIKQFYKKLHSVWDKNPRNVVIES